MLPSHPANLWPPRPETRVSFISVLLNDGPFLPEASPGTSAFEMLSPTVVQAPGLTMGPIQHPLIRHISFSNVTCLT